MLLNHFKSFQTCNLVASTTGEGPNHWHFIYMASPGSIWKASSSDQLSAASGVQACTPVPHPDQQLGKTEHHVKNAPDFADKARNLKLNTVSYDVTSQFTCIPPLDAITGQVEWRNNFPRNSHSPTELGYLGNERSLTSFSGTMPSHWFRHVDRLKWLKSRQKKWKPLMTTSMQWIIIGSAKVGQY